MPTLLSRGEEKLIDTRKAPTTVLTRGKSAIIMMQILSMIFLIHTKPKFNGVFQLKKTKTLEIHLWQIHVGGSHQNLDCKNNKRECLRSVS